MNRPSFFFPAAPRKFSVPSYVAFASPNMTMFDHPIMPDVLYSAFVADLERPVRLWLSSASSAVDFGDERSIKKVMKAIANVLPLETLSRIFGDALLFAWLVGRASVINEAQEDGLNRSDMFGAESANFADELIYEGAPFKQAVEFLRQKVPMGTKEWRDAVRQMHDRSFVVAGEMKTEVLEDIQAALLKGLEEGDEAGFRQEFDRLVTSGKWTGDPELLTDDKKRGWRSKIIYRTNMATAHAAGRRKQQIALLDVLPFWQYRHAATRTPKRPRPGHVRLDGLTLPGDDPTWDRIYAPNGFLCSCAIRAITQSAADRAHPNHRQPPTEADIAELVPLEWQYSRLDPTGGRKKDRES